MELVSRIATQERLYRHAVTMFKLFNNMICEDEFIELNFQLYDNDRNRMLTFTKIQRFDVGQNILLNRFHDLNNKIDKNWLNVSLETYQTRCRALFLENGSMPDLINN